MESSSPAFRIFLYFCQKHTPKSRKFNVWPTFTCGTDSCVVPWREMYSNDYDDDDNGSVRSIVIQGPGDWDGSFMTHFT